MKDIGGRVAVVTGGSRGIGPYIARTLFDHGMKVVLAARSIDDVEAVRKDFDPRGVRSLAVKSDVTDEADRKGLLGPVTLAGRNPEAWSNVWKSRYDGSPG